MCAFSFFFPWKFLFSVVIRLNRKQGSRYKLTYDGMYHLDIPKTRQYDHGKVEVIARSSVGESRTETTLTVKPRSDDYRGVLKNSPRRKFATQKTDRLIQKHVVAFFASSQTQLYMFYSSTIFYRPQTFIHEYQPDSDKFFRTYWNLSIHHIAKDARTYKDETKLYNPSIRRTLAQRYTTRKKKKRKVNSI